MQEFVTINEKKYFPSTMLAGTFGYTPDYIGKLAREEKILGLQIGRQWFVEKTSLEIYLQKITIEKQIQKDALRLLRKTERLTHERENEKALISIEQKFKPLVVASQAFALLLCGVLIGGLGWVSVSKQLSPSSVIASVAETLQFASLRMIPPLDSFTNLRFGFDTADLFASSMSAKSQGELKKSTSVLEDENSIFTILPQVNSEQTEKESIQGAIVGSTQIKFSDEVRISVDAKGEYYLEPLLREEEGASSPQVISAESLPNNVLE